MKFTFKKHKKEGKYRSFQKDYTDVKLNGKYVGSIQEQKDSTYKIGFHIENEKMGESDPCPFRWIFLKQVCESEKEAREFINKWGDTIQSRYKLFQRED